MSNLHGTVTWKNVDAPISGLAYHKQRYTKGMTEDVLGRLSYPVEPEPEPVEEEREEVSPIEKSVFTGSDHKGTRPHQITWIEDGLFATCKTPVSPTYDAQYQWLIENQVSVLVALESWTPKLVKHQEKQLEDVLIRVPNFSAPSLD